MSNILPKSSHKTKTPPPLTCFTLFAGLFCRKIHAYNWKTRPYIFVLLKTIVYSSYKSGSWSVERTVQARH